MKIISRMLIAIGAIGFLVIGTVLICFGHMEGTFLNTLGGILVGILTLS